MTVLHQHIAPRAALLHQRNMVGGNVTHNEVIVFAVRRLAGDEVRGISVRKRQLTHRPIDDALDCILNSEVQRVV